MTATRRPHALAATVALSGDRSNYSINFIEPAFLGQDPGPGIAQVATIGYGGFLLGPPVIGFVAEHLGLRAALGIALAGAALVALLGGRAFALVRRVQEKESPA